MIINKSQYKIIGVIIFITSLQFVSCKKVEGSKDITAITMQIEQSYDYDEQVKKILDYLPRYHFLIDSTAQANHETEYDESGKALNPFHQRIESFVMDTVIEIEKGEYQDIEIIISKGHIFDSELVHLIVRYGNRSDIYVRNQAEFYILHDIISDDRYNNVVHSDIEIHVEGDTIFDINGDGHKDYAIHLYSQSGCCPRDVYRVYLYLPHCGGFTPYYELMNPTFYPKDKKVRGMSYGFSGEVPLYEKEWIGVELKDLRYIYPNYNDKKGFSYVECKNENDSLEDKNSKTLKRIPKEFLNINGIDYFEAIL